MPRKHTNKSSRVRPSAKPSLPAKKYSTSQIRHYLNEHPFLGEDPHHVLQNLADYFSRTDNDPNKGSEAELSPLLQKALPINNLNNHSLLMLTTKEKYNSFSIEFARDLIKEYSCTSASEKALVQLITSAFIRCLEYAEMLSNNCSGKKPFTAERNGLYGVLSKEIDRAQRQYVAGLNALINMKRPPLKVTFKADTAFVAQNQQINAEQSSSPQEKNNARQ